MKRNKRILSLLLALAMVACLIPLYGTTASAAQNLEKPKVYWNGTTLEWTKVKNAQCYFFTLWALYPNDDIGIVLEGNYTPDAPADQSEFIYRIGDDIQLVDFNWDKELVYDQNTGRFRLDLKKYYTFANDVLYDFCVAVSYYDENGDIVTDDDGSAVYSERVLGETLKGGYTSPIPIPGKVEAGGQSNPAKTGKAMSCRFLNGLENVPVEKLHFQWQYRPGRSTEAKNIPGATTRKYIIGEEYAGQQIRVKVTADGYGGSLVSEWWDVEKPELNNPFVDIYKTDDYYDAVLWAYYADPQITNGIDTTHFGPKMTVTRGQAVTFLWRAMGCPDPKTTANPFKDVSSGEYYYKPILWAVEKGITKGTSATAFSPSLKLTTAHMITFLYRTKNTGKDGWYQEAASWAGKNYGGKPFGVNIAVNDSTDCPRCNVVQFLQKAK